VGDISYRRHRFPPEIVQHAVWLYFRFPLSYRNVEDLLAERGIDLSYETVRRWALKFGTLYARKLRKLRPRPSGRWHLDEVFVSIGGRRMYLWRAVDDEGEVLDILVQARRDKRSALKLTRKLLKKTPEQPGGEFASAGATAGEAHAALQVATIGAALPLHPRRSLQHLQHPAPPDLPQNDAGVPR
jgi:putative transposase